MENNEVIMTKVIHRVITEHLGITEEKQINAVTSGIIYGFIMA